MLKVRGGGGFLEDLEVTPLTGWFGGITDIADFRKRGGGSLCSRAADSTKTFDRGSGYVLTP